MQHDDTAGPRPHGDEAAIDLGVHLPHCARIYNHLLDGVTCFTADREFAAEITALFPDVRLAAWENRMFITRAAAYLARRGLRQFLDIGAGIPFSPDLHEIVQAIAPQARIVYVDHDPIVLTHLHALTTSDPRGKVSALHGDLAEPQQILQALAQDATLDLDEPIALSLNAVLHHLSDADSPERSVKTLKAQLAPGSALMLTHAASDLRQGQMAKVAAACREAGMPFHPRTREQVEAFFDGWYLVEPGLTTTARWRPNYDPGTAESAACYAGVAIEIDTASPDPPHRAPTDEASAHPQYPKPFNPWSAHLAEQQGTHS